MQLQDFGRGARIELSKMAKLLGMKFIGYNAKAQEVSLEVQGKGVTYPLEEFVQHYENMCPQSVCPTA
ncbi:MAG TPA: hypothetical protein VFC58_02470 [Desulfosporosinus sp.]|nr:hypothetical protein [Desulfosporosinus sp.]